MCTPVNGDRAQLALPTQEAPSPTLGATSSHGRDTSDVRHSRAAASGKTRAEAIL